ncbi:MAG: J domain-containing protein [Bryobacterales bacterium]|nr:J domain-containing protein [Bryobacterales bacterium]
MATENYYETLGVGKKATQEEIRKAYKRLARKHHPDLNPSDKVAEDRFKKVQEAYSILNDPKKREVYDQYGFYSDNIPPGGPPPGGGYRPGPGMDFNGFDFGDFAGAAGAGAGGFPGADTGGGGGFRDLFDQFFKRSGGGASRAPQKQPGTDLEYGLDIDFWQAIRGAQVRLTINRQEPCATCGGTGAAGGSETICPQCHGGGTVEQNAGAMRFKVTCSRCGGTGRLRNACPTCHGDGRVARQDTVEVRIPAGARTGSRLRISGKGNAGAGGGAPGDLYITTRVQPHPVFDWQGDDIHVKLPITVSEAGLGAKIDVPTIDGRATLRIPPGTQNGQKLRMREKGVMNSKSGKRGDEIVEIVLRAPDTRDEKVRDLLKELQAADQADPREELWTKV